MAVPKATVNKNNGFETTQYYVRASGEILVMESITKTPAMKEATHKHFGLGVLPFYRRHTIMALLFRHCICHVIIRQK